MNDAGHSRQDWPESATPRSWSLSQKARARFAHQVDTFSRGLDTFRVTAAETESPAAPKDEQQEVGGLSQREMGLSGNGAATQPPGAARQDRNMPLVGDVTSGGPLADALVHVMPDMRRVRSLQNDVLGALGRVLTFLVVHVMRTAPPIGP